MKREREAAAVTDPNLNMKLLHLMICFFLSALWVRNTEQVHFYTRIKGRDVTVRFQMSSPGSRKFFCQETCDRGNLLIETPEDRAQSGRYSIRFEEGAAGGGGALSVSITQLKTSDTGLYRCGLGSSASSASFKEFEVVVIDALLKRHHSPSAEEPVCTTRGGDLTVACVFTSLGSSYFLCKGKCEEEENILSETDGVRATRGRYSTEFRKGRHTGGIVFVSITQLSGSDSGRYRCGLDRTFTPHSYRDFDVIVRDAPPGSNPDSTLQPFSTSSSTQSPEADNRTIRTTEQTQTEILVTGTLLYVGLTLVVAVVLLSLVVLIVYMKRRIKPSGLRTRGNSGTIYTEFPLYENQLPVSTHEESTYQSLDAATRDQNQIYSTLTHIKQT
ncbi:uncharacterized protein LOC113167412 isoform X1 [Anabas testudineus]|uniref:uncharacterized protein LOC113167412 isoform X1 n=1 Tax=Anabas testudineus TaxID=64144 RepID=UPI000E45F584|nr:uncharacterized protein LOC113167412 isoform X1 [Anabas testudineus]